MSNIAQFAQGNLMPNSDLSSERAAPRHPSDSSAATASIVWDDPVGQLLIVEDRRTQAELLRRDFKTHDSDHFINGRLAGKAAADAQAGDLGWEDTHPYHTLHVTSRQEARKLITARTRHP